MADTKGYTVYHLAWPASIIIVLINPIEIINANFRQAFGAAYEMCFRYDQMCDIDAYAILIGTALPYAILTFFILLFFSNKQEKLVGFLTLLGAFAVAHALHA